MQSFIKYTSKYLLKHFVVASFYFKRLIINHKM